MHAATVRGVEIDTGFFSGNHAPEIEVQGCCRLAGKDGQPPAGGGMHGNREGVGGGVKTAHDDDAKQQEQRKVDEIVTGRDFPGWVTILPRSMCGPACRQAWLLPPLNNGRGRKVEAGTQTSQEGATEDEPFYTHIRLLMYPDGGIGRFRLFGNVVPPPTPEDLPTSPSRAGIPSPLVDLASVHNGSIAISASDAYFSPPNNLLLDGRGMDMSDGWETKRSREKGNKDWTIIKLGGDGGLVEKVVVDTAFFRGNFPVSCYIEAWTGKDPPTGKDGEGEAWELLAEVGECGPDKEHEAKLNKEWNTRSTRYVKLVIVPDGGVKRLRVWGRRSGTQIKT